MASSSSNFMKKRGIMGILHYFVFPIDLFASKDSHFLAARRQRNIELVPIMVWLIPLILLLTSTTALNGVGLIIFCLLEILMLVLLSAVYCWRGHIGFLVELFSNYALCFLIWAFLLFVVFSLLPCISCELIVFIGFIILSIFFRGDGDYYDDDW